MVIILQVLLCRHYNITLNLLLSRRLGQGGSGYESACFIIVFQMTVVHFKMRNESIHSFMIKVMSSAFQPFIITTHACMHITEAHEWNVGDFTLSIQYWRLDKFRVGARSLVKKSSTCYACSWLAMVKKASHHDSTPNTDVNKYWWEELDVP